LSQGTLKYICFKKKKKKKVTVDVLSEIWDKDLFLRLVSFTYIGSREEIQMATKAVRTNLYPFHTTDNL